MNSFMNALYGAVGAEVSGFKNDVAFLGKIVDTRLKYGADISVTVETEDDTFLVDGSTLFNGEGSGFRNLYVYF